MGNMIDTGGYTQSHGNKTERYKSIVKEVFQIRNVDESRQL